MNSSLTPQKILSFYKKAEKLKSTLRHSWVSDKKRQESVAEHTWMMSLLALILIPQLQQKLDEQKVLSMILIHDLAEAVTEDMPIWQGEANKKLKSDAERKAILEIFNTLDGVMSKKLLTLWEEYEERKSPEAKFVKVLDTIDVVAQHNAAPIETWDDNDFLWQLSPLQNSFFDFDPSMRKLKDAIDMWSIKKVKAVGKLDKLDQIELKKRSA